MTSARRIGLTQRVDVWADRGERRDALDQRWSALLELLGAWALPIPNAARDVRALIRELRIDGVILTGGNDLVAYGGDAPERDRLENEILDVSLADGLPVVGVCRGMQLIQHRFGGALERVSGHIGTSDIHLPDAGVRRVNSFHTFGFLTAPDGFQVWARASDGVIEGMSHCTHAIHGMMWHPERNEPPEREDVVLLERLLR